jgi:hypothetical protein
VISPSERRFPIRSGIGALLSVRALIGVGLLLLVAPLSVDDYFRIFHALWWWQSPSFTSSHEWLPGQTYIYGPLVGLFGDTVLAPRVLTLLLHLAGGLVLAANRSLTPGVRWLAGIWILCSPLALALGTVPLTESLFALLLLVGIVGLERFLSHGKSPQLLLAAVGYLGATMVRYEAWALLPVYSAFALSRPPERYFALVNRALAFVPWFFPLVWTLLLWALQGEPFTYLRIVKEDHFGAGDLCAAVTGACGVVTAIQVLLAITALVASAVALARRSVRLGDLLWEAHLLAAVGFTALVVASGSVPSQFSQRLFYPVLLLGAVPLARMIAFRVAATGRQLAIGSAVGAALLGLGALALSGLSPGVREENLVAGEYLRDAFAGGDLAPDEHVLVEHALPDAAAVLVFANRPDRVHIDRMGGGICPPRLLGTLELVCPVEPWAPRVRVALVRRSDAAESLELRGWRAGPTFGPWQVYTCPPDGVPLGRSLGPPRT